MADRPLSQHAFAGELHLETRFLDGQWEWEVLKVKHNERINRGRAESLEDAKEKAERVARTQGMEGEPKWESIT